MNCAGVLSKRSDMPGARPFFSVVVPVYNKAPCLERVIGSVLKQTCADLELLLVDDASTDESLDIIKRFSDSRIRRCHRAVPGAGGYAARNLAIAESRGVWVAFLDADDEWEPEHLEVLRELTLDSRGGVVTTSWLINHGCDTLRRNSFSVLKASSTKIKLDFSGFLQETAKGRIPMWTGSVAARRELLQRVGGFPEQCRRGGDTVTWLHLVKAADELIVSTRHTAIYHREESFVTEATRPEVKDNCVYNACRVLLNEVSGRKISRLLMRVSNRHVGYGLRVRAREGALRFSDCDAHYFKGDWQEHLWFRIQSLLPHWLRRYVRSGLLVARKAVRSVSSSRRSRAS